jgi:cellulose synthase (UDP-forming)
MGHFGRQTGFPVLRVVVAGTEALQQGAKKDFLILGTGDDQSAFDNLASHLPVSLGNGQIQVRDTEGFFVPLLRHAWWKLNTEEHTESGELTVTGTPDAVIEGIKSPFNSLESRSIVLIHLKDTAVFEPFMATFLRAQEGSEIMGTVSVLHGTQFQSFRIGANVYHVGVLPLWTRCSLWFMQMSWLSAVIVLVLAFLLSIWMRQWLRARAKRRLMMRDE